LLLAAVVVATAEFETVGVEEEDDEDDEEEEEREDLAPNAEDRAATLDATTAG
jgi:hypothetical protein